MTYKSFDYNVFTVILFISITSIFNLHAERSSIDFPGWFMKNQNQFDNGSKYCLKTTKSNTFFFNQYIVHQFISEKRELDSTNPVIFNLRIDFENSNPHPSFIEGETLTSKSNFFIGNDASAWKTEITSFGTLSYKELYDSIDLKYYNSVIGIKNDFVVHAGGDYTDIILKYSGVKNISINDMGALQLSTDIGEITEHIPQAYQVINGIKILVNVNYRLEEDFKVRFEVQNYDAAYDLVIDPQLIYSSYIGGSADDFLWSGDIERDSFNNIYFTGRSSSFNFPVTPGVYSTTPTGSMDVFVLKMNPEGNIIFSTFIGGFGNDMGYGIELAGPENDIIVTGDASSTFPTTSGTYQPSFNGGSYDVFVLKLNNTGNNLLFSTFLGGSLEDQPFDIALDNNLDIYVVGQTAGDFPATTGSYQEHFGGGSYDMFVSKLSADGSSLIKSTYIGGTSTDRGVGIIVDASGNIFVSAFTTGSFPTTPGCFDNSYNGGSYDIVVTKLSSSFADLIYSTFIGTAGEDLVRGDLFLDNSGNLLVVGKAGSGFPVTSGSFQPSFGGGATDGLIVKLNATGTGLIYASYLGGNGDDMIHNAVIDVNANIIVTGYCGSGFPVTDCAYDENYNGNTDVFVAKINSSATQLIYSTYFGGGNIDNGMAVTTYNDTIIVVGETQSSDLPVTTNAFDQTYNGLLDVFLMKLFPGSGDSPVAQFNNPTVLCVNQSFSFINTSINSINYNWDFGDGFKSIIENPTHSYSKQGNYLVSLIASTPCSIDTVTTTININGFISTKSISICSGDSILLNGIYRYNSGNYNEIYPTTSGCDSIITTNLVVNPIKQTTITPSICMGDTYIVGISSYTSAGTYTDKFKTFSGCDSIITTTLSVYPIQQTTQNPAICQGEELIVGPHQYIITGSYIDILTAYTGCDSIITTNLTVNPLPSISLGNDTILCQGDILILAPGSGFLNYLWSDGSELSVLNVTKPGIYTVTVSNTWCSASDDITIDECGAELFFPNVFTPNNDGINEHFKPVFLGTINSYKIMVYNRWGQLLYESDDAYAGWDGTFKGGKCPEGVYYFLANYTTGTGLPMLKQKVKRGSVTILR
ncbi:MAG: gliding motility-associated C-terminal domain-containing protein [Lentimicrobiaceae bacterium]|jgi:gliding motility-associated-like protein